MFGWGLGNVLFFSSLFLLLSLLLFSFFFISILIPQLARYLSWKIPAYRHACCMCCDYLLVHIDMEGCCVGLRTGEYYILLLSFSPSPPPPRNLSTTPVCRVWRDYWCVSRYALKSLKYLPSVDYTDHLYWTANGRWLIHPRYHPTYQPTKPYHSTAAVFHWQIQTFYHCTLLLQLLPTTFARQEQSKETGFCFGWVILWHF